MYPGLVTVGCAKSSSSASSVIRREAPPRVFSTPIYGASQAERLAQFGVDLRCGRRLAGRARV